MNIEEIKQLINSKEYDFLRTDPILKNHLCYLTLGGSYSYGTAVENQKMLIEGKEIIHTSDLDLRGIYLNSSEEILTMNCTEKPYEPEFGDVSIYPLKQMIKLLISCNPNTIEQMGTKEEHILYITEEGKLLRDNIHLFLSKKAIASFCGYAIQQMRRLENALARDSYPQAEKEDHIKGSIQKQMLTFMDRYQPVTDENLKLYLDKSNKKDFDKEIFIDLNLSHYSLRDLKGMYNEMSQIINDYSSIGHRNSKKDQIHLQKHSMHLIRLLVMLKSILQGEGIITYREKEHDLLMDIRLGKYSYKEIFELNEKLNKEIEYAKKNTILPDQPDYEGINKLVMQINRNVILKNL